MPKILENNGKPMPAHGRDDLPLKHTGRKFQRSCSYEPEYCDLLIDMMARGCTYTQVAAEIGVVMQTFDNWRRDHDDFRDAYALGKVLARAWWEEQAQESLVTYKQRGMPEKIFNTSLYMFSMRCHFGVNDKDPVVLVNVGEQSNVDKVADLVKKLHRSET